MIKSLSLISLIILFISGGQNVYSPKDIPVAKKGILDLSDWEFNEKGFVYLNGEWVFFWKKLISPDQIISDQIEGYLTIPNSWNEVKNDGVKYSEYGYATLKLKIKIEKSGRYSVYVPSIHMAHKFWIDNNLIGSKGEVGTNKHDEKQQIINYVSDFYLTSGVHDITLWISNYQFTDGGIHLPIIFGEYDQILLYRYIKIMWECFIFGFIGFMMLSHIFIYLLNKKDLSNLYFVILCLCSLIYFLLRGERLLLSFFPDIEWDFFSKILFISVYSYMPALLLFNSNLYPEYLSNNISKYIKRIWLIFFLIVLLFPTSFFVRILPLYELIFLPLFVFMIFKSVRIFKSKKRGSFLNLFGFIIIIIGIIHELLYENEIVSISMMVSYYIFFLFSQSILIAIKSSYTYNKLEENKKEIEYKNIELKRLNSVKDNFIAKTSHELRTPLNGIIGITESVMDGSLGRISGTIKEGVQNSVSVE